MMKHVLVAVGLGLVISSSLFAQRTQPQEVYKILGVSVEGNVLADPVAVIANSGLRVGDEITVPGDQIAQAIRKLWSLRIFSDIQIAVDQKVGQGVYLVLRVKELPRYERTDLAGNDGISTSDIEKKITLVRGQVFPPQESVRLKKEITKLYEEEGYLLADVRVTAVPVDTNKNRIVLKIDIDEGKDVSVDQIMFEGNKAFDESDLRGAMSETSQKSWWKFWSSANLHRKKYEEDKKLIVQFYRKNGFRDAQVLSDSIWYSQDRRDAYVLIHIYEGPQYRVRNIAWVGNSVYSDTVLSERLGFSNGDIYNAEKFEQNLRGNESQTDVASLYLDNGYLRLNMDPVETRVGKDSVDITITVYEMNQFKIGTVGIKGNTKTQEKVIRRELFTRPGDYFSRAAILRSLRQLQQLNYFNPEKLKPDYALVDDKTVDLTYEVEEKSSDNVNASVGYSGAFGFTGALGFTINNFSISEPFRGGAGQILNFEWMFGQASRIRTFTIGFTEPWMFDSPTLLGVSLYDTRQIYTYDLSQTGGTIRVGRRFRWPDIYWRGDLTLRAQRNDVTSGRGIYREGKSSQVSLGLILSRNDTDNPIFPSSGSVFTFSAEMSGGPFLPGDIDYHKWGLQADFYLPLVSSGKLVLYFSTQYGFLKEFGSNAIIPPIDLYFMGGTGLGYIATTPLRGYIDQSVGPRNVRGDIIGGMAMTKTTLELRFAVSMSPIPIYFLGFAEGGNVYRSIQTADFFSLARAAGFGARIQIMPLGMFGFDYGYGFDDIYPRDGHPDGWRFHFVFGRGM
jgi:outer membrane protein insertion porin family